MIGNWGGEIGFIRHNIYIGDYMIGLFVIQLQPVYRMKQGRKAMHISGALT